MNFLKVISLNPIINIKKTILFLLFTGAFVSVSSGAIITDTSNNDGGTVSVIDGDLTGEEIDVAATGATALATLNTNLDYVVSNWGSSTWDNDTNTLQNVGGLLDITISETFPDNRGYDPSTDTGRASTGTSAIATDFTDNVQVTIDFSSAVDAAGFVITNLGGAYDNSAGGILTATFHTAAGGTGSIISTQAWSSGGSDGDSGDNGQADAYFGLSGAGSFLSIVLDIQRDGNTGNGGTGLDDLGFGVVPEPSTYALLAGFFTLGAVMFQRRRKS